MKITKLFIALIAISAVSLVGYSKYNTSDSSTLLMENVEALTDDEVSMYLNGPQKKYDCPGWFTGSGFRCAAEIETNCEQILCR